MLLALDTIPRSHNLLAAFLAWLLLAGYFVFPATFTSVQRNAGLDAAAQAGSVLAQDVLGEVRNAPLLWIAGASCVLGGGGLTGLWVRWRGNYVWLGELLMMGGGEN